jgi:hypothetical protein
MLQSFRANCAVVSGRPTIAGIVRSLAACLVALLVAACTSGGGVPFVDVGPDCHPSITNGSVATDNTHDVMVAIDEMIGIRCSALIC